jgi:hypothetical protein
MIDAIGTLNADVIVFTEYVPRDPKRPHNPRGLSRDEFVTRLSSLELTHTLLSPLASSGNHVLIASRHRLETGKLRPPQDLVAVAPCMSSNTFHVRLPDEDFEILGLRVPDYSKQPPVRRACWDWIMETAASAVRRPFVMIGDFNVDPQYPSAKCGDRIHKLKADDWQHAAIKGEASYWTPGGHGVQLDHAFFSNYFTVDRVRYVTEEQGHVFATPPPRRANALSDHAALVVDATRSPAQGGKPASNA